MSKVKPSPLPPDTVIGGYRIIRKVAAGGFGLVYLALDPDGQQVAVKEYTVTAGVKHKFTDRIMGNAKLGYINSRNETTGGNTNFKGPLVYVSLEYAL